MQLTRQEDVSLYFYIRDRVMGPPFAELTQGASLVLVSPGIWNMDYDDDPTTSFFPFRRPEHTGLGRGLLYFDVINGNCTNFGTEQTTMVRVYKGSTLLTPTVDYKVNYITGQIYSSLDLTGYSVDYYWNYVAFLDAWPDANT